MRMEKWLTVHGYVNLIRDQNLIEYILDITAVIHCNANRSVSYPKKKMTSFLFRRAKQSDLEEIINLLADDELGKQRENLSEKIFSNYQNAFERIDADPNQFLMVIEENGAILGTCHLTLIPSLTFQGGLRMNIEAVRIAASCRGQGVGEWMIQQAISLGQKEGCKIIQLTTNKERVEAKRFYEKLGFTATHEGMKMYTETT